MARTVFFRDARQQSLVVQRLGHALSQFFEGQRCRSRSSAHEVGPRAEVADLLRHHCPQPSPQAIAPDGTTHSATDGISHSDVIRDGSSGVGYRDRSPSHPPGRPTEGGEGGPVANGVDQGIRSAVPIRQEPGQAESLWRPFWRRDRRIARPARVDIRWRNPCFLARRRFFGWKVRFT